MYILLLNTTIVYNDSVTTCQWSFEIYTYKWSRQAATFLVTSKGLKIAVSIHYINQFLQMFVLSIIMTS